eukprot:symbB.v1.2.007507.t1/scaffold444.1/size204903/7
MTSRTSGSLVYDVTCESLVVRENTFAGEQKTILNSVPDFSSSMSMTETIQKMKQDEEDKKTKQNDAEVSEEEDPEQSAKQKIKKLRRDAGLDVEEIDEDEELQMLQALELEEQGELSIEETAPVATSKRKSSHRDKAGAPPPPPVCSPVKKQRHSLSTPAVSTSASLPSAVPSSPKITAATSSSAQKLIQGGGNDVRTQPEEELRLLEGWGKCRPFLADEYCSTEANSPFCPPTTLAKEVQKSKWIAEIVKLKPFVAVLERTLAVDSVKWKQTDVQNAIKALNKITNKTDRKLEFEASVASKEEPALSQRTSSLKEAFEAVKTLKDLAIVRIYGRFLLLLSRVLKLQSKWILQVLVRLCSSQKSDEAISALKAFIPLEFQEAISQSVLSTSLAKALEIWYVLIHVSSPSASPKLQETLESVLPDAVSHLTDRTLVSYHRPLSRLSTLTHFKQLLHIGHQAIVGLKLDREASQKATQLQTLLDQIANDAKPLTLESTEGKFVFGAAEVIVIVSRDIVNMKHLTSELPSDATSQHQTIKQKGIDCINKGLIQINEYLVKGLLATLAEVASPDGLVPKIPSSLTELCRFVKTKDVSVRSGKVDPQAKGFHLLPYLPFSHRAFFIYIADFIVALKIQRLLLAENMEEVCKPPYTAVLDFLEYTFAACDSNRIGNADVVSAAKPFMDTLAATAKVFSVRLLAALENLEDGHDKLELDFAIVQVKPWLDLKDKSTLASIKNVIRKVKSGCKEAAQLPSELNQAMLELQDVIGLKGSELCRLTDASTQKIKDTVYAMNTLGTCFANLESKYTTWIKSVPSEDQMSEDQKSLNEDMNSLMMTAKILLACQSCCIMLGKDNAEKELDKFLLKLGKRDLSVESLPASLQDAIVNLQKRH